MARSLKTVNVRASVVDDVEIEGGGAPRDSTRDFGPELAGLAEHSWTQVVGVPQGTKIVFDEVGTGCVPTASGERLSLLFCDPPIVRTYPVVVASGFTCPGTNSLGMLEQNGAIRQVGASGTLTITDVSGGCTAGAFSITNPMNETLNGTFDAYVCP